MEENLTSKLCVLCLRSLPNECRRKNRKSIEKSWILTLRECLSVHIPLNENDEVCAKCEAFVRKIASFRATVLENLQIIKEINHNDRPLMMPIEEKQELLRINVKPEKTTHEQFIKLEENEDVERNDSCENEIKCDECPEMFKSKRSLTKHLNVKHKTKKKIKPKICHVCGKSYKNHDHLLNHQSEHAQIKPIDVEKSMAEHVCVTCGKILKTKTILHEHIHRMHEPNEMVNCPTCAKSYPKHSLNKHIRYLHKLPKNFECNVCAMRFKTKADVQRHVRRHTDERPYLCKFCPMRFRDSKVMRHHEMRHTGEKPHVCDVCERAFIQKSTLTIHMRTHTGQRDYRCQLCPKAYTHASTLTMHLKSHK